MLPVVLEWGKMLLQLAAAVVNVAIVG